MDFTNRGVVNSTLRKAAKRLEMVHIATNVTCITKAKVPIIKFVDRVTNINVDISFENLSGVQAQATFQQWKHDYPDMIYMVALLKQFLVMRGMNEVHTGGIGGFSIICLIISYFQHSKKPENLGDCFLGFLNYYGNEFDLRSQRIQMHPPAIIRKSTNVRPRTRISTTVSAGTSQTSHRVIATTHGTTTREVPSTTMNRDLRRQGQRCGHAPQSAVGHCRGRRHGSERLRVGRAHFGAVAAVAARAAWGCVGFEPAGGHGGVAAGATRACWTAGCGGWGALGFAAGRFQTG